MRRSMVGIAVAAVAVTLTPALADGTSSAGAPPGMNSSYQPTNQEWLARYEDGQQPVSNVMGGPTNPSAKLVRSPAGVVQPGQPVDFDASGSIARHGNFYGGTRIVNWIWDFGDGTQANAPHVTHIFDAVGVYHVTLTVHDDTGWRSQRTEVVDVGGSSGDFVNEELEIPTGDGLVMHGWVSRPQGPGPFPVILIYGPYGTGPASNTLGDDYGDFVRNGYAFAQVAAPGRELSTGHFDLFGRQTQQGGYDAVEWLASQPWSSGNVGLWGLSGPACGGLLTAGARPPHLAAVVAKSCYADLYRDMAYAGGVPNSNTFIDAWIPALLAQDEGGLQSSGRYTDIAGRAADDASLLTQMQQHTYDDAWWQERSIVDYPTPTAAVLYYGNERDLWPRASVEYSRWIAPANGEVVDIPGGHTQPDLSGWEAGRDSPDFLAGEAKLWFDHYLKGTDNGVENHPQAVSLDTFGGDVAAAFDFGRWQQTDGMPDSSAVPTRLYLHPTGTDSTEPAFHSLSTSLPAAGDLPTLATYSPAQGATSDDTAATATPVAGLQASWEAQSLVFETDPLTHELPVDGPADLSFYATLPVQDTAFTVHLDDVWPDGSSHYISKGALLATHRALDESRSLYVSAADGTSVLVQPYHPHTQDAVQTLLPGTVYRFDVEIWNVHNVWLPGHRLRLAIALQDLGWRTHWEPGATAVIFDDASDPSVLNLPTLPAASVHSPF